MPVLRFPVGSSSPLGTSYSSIISLDDDFSTDLSFTQTPKSPGTRCPTCAAEGNEVWVIPGRSCGYCGTPCDLEEIRD